MNGRFGVISAKFRTFAIQTFSSIPPIFAFSGQLEEFLFLHIKGTKFLTIYQSICYKVFNNLRLSLFIFAHLETPRGQAPDTLDETLPEYPNFIKLLIMIFLSFPDSLYLSWKYEAGEVLIL